MEEPFEWVYPYRYGVTRRYLSGPLEEMRTLAELTPQPGGGSRLVYEVWARPKNLLGVVAIPIQIGLWNAYTFDGSTVNLAARLEGLSSGGGVVISDSVRHDPEVMRYFDELGDLLRLEPFTSTVKGFDQENFRLWRVTLTQTDTFSQLVSHPK